jgi:NAD(P)-dependent dehydrogenase (short-subunit alcohol dehydrogenase family)
MSDTLTGKVVLITGAARGIGAATARDLARRGARLILTDLDAAPLEELAGELGPDRALAVACDVCDLESMEGAVAFGVERFGGIDLVLANAGIASYGSVLAVDPTMVRRVLDVNVLGVFHTVRAALPSLIERHGYVLIVSSLAAFAPAPGLAPYCASKAGVEHMASALRLEVAHHGVEIGTAHMSWIDTPLVQDARSDLPSFRQMLSVLPPPLGKTTSVDVCVRAFVRGLAGRKRRVYVPGWVRVLGWVKPLITSPVGERESLKHVPTVLPQMDAEVAALGRSTCARNVAMEDVAVSPR